MGRRRRFLILLAAAAAAVAVVRHGRGAAMGRRVAGGILIGDAAVYDRLSRLLLGPFLGRIAADVAAAAQDGVRVLEVGCGAWPPVDPIGAPARPGGDRSGPGSGHDRPRPHQRRPPGRRRGAQAVVPGRRRGLAGIPRPILRPGGQHAVDAPLGRPGGRPGRDRPRAAPWRPGAGLGLPTRRPAPSVRTTPCPPARSGPTHTRQSASGGNRDPVALALKARPHPADRAGPRRRRLSRPSST